MSTYYSNFFSNDNKLINNKYNSSNNKLNNFKLEYVIGKGGFGKVSNNNKYYLYKKKNRYGKYNAKLTKNIMQ